MKTQALRCRRQARTKRFLRREEDSTRKNTFPTVRMATIKLLGFCISAPIVAAAKTYPRPSLAPIHPKVTGRPVFER